MIPRLIVALDYGREDAALAMVERLGDACDFYKVGLELFVAAGPSVVTRLVDRGKEVFLDLKLHDIPTTVRGAARSAATLGARLVTVHASGGAAMLAAGVAGAGDRCGVLAVTVLTSLDGAALASAWGRAGSGDGAPIEIGAEVLRLSQTAESVGAHGVVCGGREAALVSARFGAGLSILVPGIRPAGVAPDDQARATTPRQAVRAGASFLVIGRAVTASADPATALAAIRSEVALA